MGVTPNMLTIIGLPLSGITTLVVAQGHMFVEGLLILFASMFDGAIARVQNAATSFGAFLDSTLDRYSESIILCKLLWYALQHPDQHGQFWSAPAEQCGMIIFIFLAVVGSLRVSNKKARAEGLGIECKTGLLARPERVVILAIGLHTGIWASRSSSGLNACNLGGAIVCHPARNTQDTSRARRYDALCA